MFIPEIQFVFFKEKGDEFHFESTFFWTGPVTVYDRSFIEAIQRSNSNANVGSNILCRYFNSIVKMISKNKGQTIEHYVETFREGLQICQCAGKSFKEGLYSVGRTGLLMRSRKERPKKEGSFCRPLRRLTGPGGQNIIWIISKSGDGVRRNRPDRTG